VRAVRHSAKVATEAELEERARAGDPGAQWALGRLLLDGPRAATDGYRGIALIEQAAAAGEGDATAMTALFSAMGVTAPPNWPLAFDRLQAAAEQGSSAAQGQLKVLARDAGAQSAAVEPSWSELRSRIDPKALFRGGDARKMSEKPRVRTVHGFASAAECAWLIDRAKVSLQPADVVDSATGSDTYASERTNSKASFQLIDMDLVLEVVRARICATTGIPLPMLEVSQVLHYATGQEFQPHVDFFDPLNAALREQLSRGQRIATFLIYLNEGFEGGETRFLDADLTFRGNLGDAIYWANVDDSGRPDRLTRHAGLPPASGEKWIFSQWLRSQPQAR
jgi:hypothetical protein